MMDNIKHVVHIMFENRSIDNVLGWLYADNDNKPPRTVIVNGTDEPDTSTAPYYNGLRENTYYNPDKDGNRHFVTKGTGGYMDVPTWDPNEEFQYVNNQCFEMPDSNPVYPQPATMGGFYKDYATWYDSPGQIMQTYTPQELPIINGLARRYAVCDMWFSSIPTQTNCNRAFAGTGNSIGHNPATGQKQAWVNNRFDETNPFKLKVNFSEKTHWGVWSDNGFNTPADWMIYHSEMWPPVDPWGKFCYTRDLFEELHDPKFDAHFASIDQFYAQAQAGTLPSYSFLEPDWGLKKWHIGINGNDYHPPCNVEPGEAFLKKIYYALATNPGLWKNTLLVITFDEHGGTYDHIPTPWGAIPPWGSNSAPPCEYGFGFDRFGVRVPAIFVSPYIQPGTVFRAADTATPFDHTSLIATLLKWKNIPKSRWGLGERVNNAPTFESIFTLQEPRTDIPDFEARPEQGPNREAPANDLQKQIAARMIHHTAQKLGIEEEYMKQLHAMHVAPSKTITELSKGLTDALREMKRHRQ